MGRTFVMGDIHGAYKALVQCLERSGFNFEEDTLIQLGDIADGWPEVYEVVEELFKIRNLIHIRGNHDDWFLEYIEKGIHPVKWEMGGEGTARSYLRQINREHLIERKMSTFLVALNPNDIPPVHQQFFRSQHYYYKDDNNRLFIHGGFDRHHTLKEQMPYTFWWNRNLWSSALSFEVMIKGDPNSKFKYKENIKEVFIGHTTTGNWGKDIPMKAANIWNLDTGAGWEGKLTIMDVDTKEYWQSDKVGELYPGELGRRKR